ncbi:MAG TPA: hypothetical protein VEW42_01380 [Candidatus Eisenbacteria bacterium]|nr:hypothetical protein [Candidatus Eisenbacteria bacterium]
MARVPMTFERVDARVAAVARFEEYSGARTVGRNGKIRRLSNAEIARALSEQSEETGLGSFTARAVGKYRRIISDKAAAR